MRGFGLIIGWMFFALSVLMASAEGVMALGTGDYDGIAASDVWTLLSGSTMGAQTGVLTLPAWLFTGLLGLTLIFACRRRNRIAQRYMYRR